MAAGDVTKHGYTRSLKLLEAATATNSPPTVVGDGHDVQDIRSGAGFLPDNASVVVKSTAGSGTMTCTLKLWGWFKASAAWAPLGPHATAANRGRLNLGNAIDEVTADNISHSEVASFPGHPDRLYCEVEAIGGTATAVSVWLVVVGG